MISAATGAMALVVAGLVREHGVEYLLAATILAGVVPGRCSGCSGSRKLMRFVPRSVMTGFVNALAILIFLAQLPAPDATAARSVYALVAAGLAIIFAVPRITKAVPAPLVAIVVLTVAGRRSAASTCPTVGDEGALPDALPMLGHPRRAAHARDAADHRPVLAHARGWSGCSSR